MTGPARLLITARGLRGLGDGAVALALPVYLSARGFSPLQIGALTTATLLGSAMLTLGIGLIPHGIAPRRLLSLACVLMLATGLGFAGLSAFWPLLVVGFIGTLNPSGGDVSLFLPLEQALLAETAPGAERTRLFARYSLAGSLMAAAGALAMAGATQLAQRLGGTEATAARAVFLAYAGLGLVAFALYARLPRSEEAAPGPAAPLGPSRGAVLRLAALFSLDSFAGGFMVQSLMALWLLNTWGLSVTAAGAFFFWAGTLTALSQLASARLAERIGLINTMVFTHIPANLCVVAAAFAPNLPVALALLLVRASLSAMDVPARTSYVMAIVTPAERAAAASLTNVPRSLAAALSPSLSGALLGASAFAWPLVIGGGLKITYDLLLLAMFRSVRPPEEAER